ncbi:Chaperone protein HtpG [Varanus komodoensis]|nr:Chaperone protein HtpG [Varanus komodoensis]
MEAEGKEFAFEEESYSKYWNDHSSKYRNHPIDSSWQKQPKTQQIDMVVVRAAQTATEKVLESNQAHPTISNKPGKLNLPIDTEKDPGLKKGEEQAQHKVEACPDTGLAPFLPTQGTAVKGLPWKTMMSGKCEELQEQPLTHSPDGGAGPLIWRKGESGGQGAKCCAMSSPAPKQRTADISPCRMLFHLNKASIKGTHRKPSPENCPGFPSVQFACSPLALVQTMETQAAAMRRKGRSFEEQLVTKVEKEKCKGLHLQGHPQKRSETEPEPTRKQGNERQAQLEENKRASTQLFFSCEWL